ncbi:MAG: gliding motility-associated protein GldE [Bacteroidota bacterium]
MESFSHNLLAFIAFDILPASKLIGEIITLIVLLSFSALFSGAEVAFFSLSPKNLQTLKNSNSERDKLIIQHLESPKKLLATLLIANNFVNVAIIILSAFISSEVLNFENSPILNFLVQIVGITFMLLLFGEVLPKVYATQHCLKVAHFIAVPLKPVYIIFAPIIYILVNSSKLIDKRLAKKPNHISIDELSHALDLTDDKSQMEEEKKMLKGIVEFGDIDVKEIMTARIDVSAVDLETNFNHLKEVIIEFGYSRIPVYSDTFDKVEGILYIKDLLPYLNNDISFEWQKLLRPAFFVPESKKINKLLQEFQEKKIHLAIVIDEYGGTSGIVTLEDIIEEIVGEINDEFDDEDVIFSKISENEFVFEGKTLINDFARVVGINPEIFDKAKGDAESLAGLILELEGKIPEKNSFVSLFNFDFKIESVDKRRIKRIRVIIKPN